VNQLSAHLTSRGNLKAPLFMNRRSKEISFCGSCSGWRVCGSQQANCHHASSKRGYTSRFKRKATTRIRKKLKKKRNNRSVVKMQNKINLGATPTLGFNSAPGAESSPKILTWGIFPIGVVETRHPWGTERLTTIFVANGRWYSYTKLTSSLRESHLSRYMKLAEWMLSHRRFGHGVYIRPIWRSIKHKF
jgi:hypothetical protein